MLVFSISSLYPTLYIGTPTVEQGSHIGREFRGKEHLLPPYVDEQNRGYRHAMPGADKSNRAYG